MLAERVRERLRFHPGLTVAASGQTERAIFESGSVADSARKLLRADWMLVGSVEPNRLDTQVRIQLVAGKASAPEWQQEFLLSQHTLAAIEETVVDSVSARLARRPPPAARTPRLNDPERDHRLSAARLLLTEHTLESTEIARKELESIFASDTAPAVAIALARATVLMLERGGLLPPEPPVPSLRRIEALLSYAFAHDSSNAEAWTIRAMAARYADPVQFRGAEAAHRRAVASDSRSADAVHQYASTLLQLGRLNEARTRLRRALDLDRGHPASLALLAELERRAEHPELTCAFANAAVAADPFDPRVYGTRALASSSWRRHGKPTPTPRRRCA
jgi:tetratricopeptide (TPR) repeat protein